MVTEFRARRDAIVDGLNALPGVQVPHAAGRLLRVPEHHRHRLQGSQLAERLLEEAGVACLSGTAFGEWGEGYLRFSYANSLENIQEALRRIRACLSA